MILGSQAVHRATKAGQQLRVDLARGFLADEFNNTWTTRYAKKRAGKPDYELSPIFHKIRM
jgi:hypothetical protein